MNVNCHIYQARNGFIYLSCNNGLIHTALTLQQISDLGLDLISLDDFSPRDFKKAYHTDQSSENAPETESTDDGPLEQAISAMLKKGVIQLTPFSRCSGIIDMTVSSKLFTIKDEILSVNEDDWNSGPAKCVAKELAQAITAGKLRFVSCTE